MTAMERVMLMELVIRFWLQCLLQSKSATESQRLLQVCLDGVCSRMLECVYVCACTCVHVRACHGSDYSDIEWQATEAVMLC